MYLSTSNRREERVIQCRLLLDRLGDRDEPYAALDVLAIVHLEILAEEHSRLWRACTSLIYFAIIEWHQVDTVLPQLDGVWHLTWQNRVDAVLTVPGWLIPDHQ
ncbi:uncharacterized protein DS421_12g363850 [Arachis hypogaea]|nr:uncharacterized protein DS421_12g363850 [Arachis hypogaea]